MSEENLIGIKDKMLKEVYDFTNGLVDIFHLLDQIKRAQEATVTHLGGQIETNNFQIVLRFKKFRQIWTKILMVLVVS